MGGIEVGPVIAYAFGLWLAPIVFCGLKGKGGFALIGVIGMVIFPPLFPVVLIGAICLAKPDSWWARRFYDSDKPRCRHLQWPRRRRLKWLHLASVVVGVDVA